MTWLSAVEAFPFTDEEWEPVEDAALALVDAIAADDDVLGASLRSELLDLLDHLRTQHGDHPFLLELIADYTEEDDAGRAALYRRALAIAVANDLPTFTIRLSFARLLLETGQPALARKELLACEPSLPGRSESEQQDWSELLAETDSTKPDEPPSRVG